MRYSGGISTTSLGPSPLGLGGSTQLCSPAGASGATGMTSALPSSSANGRQVLL
jgi:hypothetical protein